MSDEVIIICNPSAGRVEDRESIRAQLERFPNAIVQFTGERGDGTRLAREAVEEGFDTVIAAGGDGTLNRVLNGIAPHADRIRMGLIPLGTGNDFAKMLALPDGIEQCIEALQAGRVRAIDMVRVTSDAVRYFVNVSAGGFSGTVNEKLTPEIKKTWGPLAYLRSAVEALPELRAYRTEVNLDEADSLALDLYNVVIANGRYVAGGTKIAPEASIEDGLLDVILLPKNDALDLAVLAVQIAAGKHLQSEDVIFRRAAKVAVKSEPGMWFNVDGELIGNEPATFEVMPRALQFLVGTEP